MKILFLIYHGFSSVSGISKKIHYQINGLRSLGHEVRVCKYEIMAEGSRCRMIDDDILSNFGKGKVAGIRSRFSYGKIIKYIINNHIDLVYSRSYHNANPFTISMFHQFRVHGIKSIIEIPTYPYDKEYLGFPFNKRFELQIDRLFRHCLAKQTNAIVTYTNDNKIFGQKTICISNGIEFESIPLKKTTNRTFQAIHFIGVAEVHFWHGYDRFIKGIGEYYNSGGKKDVFFHIVGGIGNSEMHDSKNAPGFTELIKEYNIGNRILFHGELYGSELDEMFEKCDFAVGSLGRHRSGVYNNKALKNREYAARGIPFIYSGDDSDFDSKPYIIKTSSDENPINIAKVINFILDLKCEPIDIRNSVKSLSWECQMERVINEVFDV